MAMEISENGVTVKFPDSKKGKYLPKTAVFRWFQKRKTKFDVCPVCEVFVKVFFSNFRLIFIPSI